MTAIITCVIAFALILFPLFVKFYAIIERNSNKVYFSVYFCLIPIFGGYCKFDNYKLYVFSNNKVKVVDLLKQIKNANSFSLFKKLCWVKSSTVLSFGVNGSKSLFLPCSFFALNRALVPIVKEKINYLKISNVLGFTSGANLIYGVKASACFNGLTVIIALIKSIFEKVTYGKSKQK